MMTKPGANTWNGSTAGRRIADGGDRNQEVGTAPVTNSLKNLAFTFAVKITDVNYKTNRAELYILRVFKLKKDCSDIPTLTKVSK